MRNAREEDTRVTRAFSGRPARGLVNRFMRDTEETAAAVLPFPWQNALTRAMRAGAARRDDADFLSLWAGQGVRLSRGGSAAALVDALVRETEATLRKLAPR